MVALVAVWAMSALSWILALGLLLGVIAIARRSAVRRAQRAADDAAPPVPIERGGRSEAPALEPIRAQIQEALIVRVADGRSGRNPLSNPRAAPGFSQCRGRTECTVPHRATAPEARHDCSRRAPHSAAGGGEPGPNLGHEVLVSTCANFPRRLES